MTEKVRKYLSDIKNAIDLINSFLEGISDFDTYVKDLKTQSAIERQLVIIGEALNKIRNDENKIEIESDRQIIAFRNRLVHAYDSIDNSIVWVILKRHLPKLKIEIEEILS
jgi:uncharacterized protein with HEPN domain